MDNVYSKTFEVRWADLDANRHLRDTAYSDFATHVRFSFLSEHGLTQSKLAELNIGPVFFRQEIKFLREVHMLEILTVDFALSGVSTDKRKFTCKQNFVKKSGECAATLIADFAWIDLSARKVITPPDIVLDILETLPHAKEFNTLAAC